jgi:hypothetical protein
VTPSQCERGVRFFARVERDLAPERIADVLDVLKQLQERGLKDAELALELTRLLERLQLLRPGVETKHFLDNWFSNWFPGQPVASIVLEAAIVACTRAIEGPQRLPITGYWVASSDDNVKVAVCKSVYQVTLLLITPEPATKVLLNAKASRPAPVWITQADKRSRVSTKQVQVAPLRGSDEPERRQPASAGKGPKRKTKGRSR